MMKTETPRQGIYFGLPEHAYHADDALGSTDMRLLAIDPAEYWEASKMNPDYDPEGTAAQSLGTAYHKMILEGREAFEAAYAPCDYPGNIKAGKAEREKIEAAGRVPLPRKEWSRIYRVNTVIRNDPETKKAFSDGIPEVSVFWESKGIRKKCRIDYLRIRSSVDLKSASSKGATMPFPNICWIAIKKLLYHIQPEHYREGRLQMARFLADGLVFGDHDARMLRRVCAESKFAWVFVFVKKDGAPKVYPCQLSPGNPLLARGRALITRAEAAWIVNMKHFGTEVPWFSATPLAELDESEVDRPYEWEFA